MSVKEDKAVDRFEQSYAQNAEDIELAIKNNNTFRNTLQLTLKKQKQALKKGSKKIVKQSKALEKIASDSEESNKNTQSLKAFELEALQRHLRNIAGDTQNVIEEVVEILSLAYSEMEQGENHERCYSIIENHVYSIVWPNLMKLCKAAYSLEETQMESAMKILGDCSPDKLGFNMSHTQPATEDYKTAVEHLKLLINMINPTKKLELLGKTDILSETYFAF